MRRLAVVGIGVAFGVTLVWGFAGLLPLGEFPSHLPEIIALSAVYERNVQNAVGSVIFDHRGFDTVGEEFILFAATAGISLILRKERRDQSDDERHRQQKQSEEALRVDSAAIRAFGGLLVPVLIVIGVYVVVHGQLTPGGGFQGGVVLATAALMIFITGRRLELRRFEPTHVFERLEAAALVGIVVVGLAGLLHGYFLQNVLPLGTFSDLFSGGTILLISTLAGVAVASGFILIITEFLEQSVVSKKDDDT